MDITAAEKAAIQTLHQKYVQACEINETAFSLVIDANNNHWETNRKELQAKADYKQAIQKHLAGLEV